MIPTDPTAERLPRDPTHPRRWPEQRLRGRVAFQIRYGIVAIGIPLAIAIDLLLLAWNADLPLLFSVQHAAQLAILLFTLAPPVGAVMGRALWRLGERRSAEASLQRAFLGTAEPVDAAGPETSQCIAYPTDSVSRDAEKLSTNGS